MITLITGAPGTGKTALLVEMLRTELADRPVYVHGLNGLQLDHSPVDAAQWHRDLPDGAVLVVDEVQQVWRPRGPGHAAPESVQALEVHRHRGIDVFLTTQKPNLLDANIRGLVGRHIHLRDTGWLGRWRYEWPECSENLAWKTCAVKKRYTLPAKAFGLYKSASEHTKVGKVRSMALWWTVGLIVAGLVAIGLAYRAITRGASGSPAPAASPAASPAPAPASSPAPAPGLPDALPAWPKYSTVALDAKREPLHERAIVLEGEWTVGRDAAAVFGLVVQGQRVASMTLAQLAGMGYSWRRLAPCIGSLVWEGRERLVTCGPGRPLEAAPAPREGHGTGAGAIASPSAS